ncbi:MAG: hypothetical protein QOG31_1918 [Thermoplasmata archaeon]|jgi:hypothetical protein|nr:hypothetical protein [Thermoplasmata archaeon]
MPAVTPGRALLGFMPEAEALGFLRSSCAMEDKTDADLRAVALASRSAANTVAAAPVETPACVPIDPVHAAHLQAVQAHVLFPEATQGVQWSFRMVEARKLLSIQKFVDLDRSQDIARDLDVGDPRAILEMCLPTKRHTHVIGIGLNADNSWTVFSRGQDFRITGGFQQEDPVTKRRTIGYHLGGGTPFVQVAVFQGRYYLKNGYHRVYELLSRGIEMVPCILVEATKLEDTGLRPGFFPPELLHGPTPPRVAHYLNDGIAIGVPLKPQTKVVRVRAEEFNLPAEACLPASLPAPMAAASAPAAPVPAVAGYLELKLIQLGGNTYRLADGTVIKIRQDLLRVLANDSQQMDLQFKLGAMLIAAMPPRNLCGAPNPMPITPEMAQATLVDANLAATPLEERPTEYELPDGRRILLSISLLGVAKSSLLDAEGEPYYSINCSTGLEMVPGPQQGPPAPAPPAEL